MARSHCIATALIVFVVSSASAQTTPLPAVAAEDRSGVLTRGAFFVALAGMQTDDPRFSLVQRSRADIDLVGYRSGRINFLMDAELVMGSERRSFDLNQANVIFEASSSFRIGGLELAGVVHHVSRHIVDRAFDRVPAWHTIGARATQAFRVRESTLAITVDYGRVVQHTFVDYTWTSQLTGRVDGRVAAAVRLFATASAGLVGVDEAIVHRGPQVGGRVEGGVHFAARAGADLFGAYERRVDGYPTSREPSSWFEVGFRLGTP